MFFLQKYLVAVVSISILHVSSIFSCNPDELSSYLVECHKGDPVYSEYVDNGISLFFDEHYLEALEQFKLVLNDYPCGNVSEIAFGSALWGKLLCDAALEQKSDMLRDMRWIEYFFFEARQCSEITPAAFSTDYLSREQLPILLISYDDNRTWFNRPNGKSYPDPSPQFATPNEKISVSDCIDRVFATAKAMKFGIAFIKKGHVAFVLNEFVDVLADRCVGCCKTGLFWTTCVSPLVVKLQKWKAFGIPNDPAWD